MQNCYITETAILYFLSLFFVRRLSRNAIPFSREPSFAQLERDSAMKNHSPFLNIIQQRDNRRVCLCLKHDKRIKSFYVLSFPLILSSHLQFIIIESIQNCLCV